MFSYSWRVLTIDRLRNASQNSRSSLPWQQRMCLQFFSHILSYTIGEHFNSRSMDEMADCLVDRTWHRLWKVVPMLQYGCLGRGRRRYSVRIISKSNFVVLEGCGVSGCIPCSLNIRSPMENGRMVNISSMILYHSIFFWCA
jgi:hypothetical protein